MSRKSLVFGVGVNDLHYSSLGDKGAKLSECKFYRRWSDMLKRCYSKKFHKEYPTYIGCSVCSDWLVFSAFKAWMEKQDWQGKHLDKDLLVQGNKVYSPETCVFVSSEVNLFLGGGKSFDGKVPSGAYFDKIAGRYSAQCRNPITKKKETIGRFDCMDAAHDAWVARKTKHAIALSEIQSDSRIAGALKTRFL